MVFKRHILMTSALATIAMGLSLGATARAQDTTAAAPSDDSTTVVVTGIRRSLQSAIKQKRNSDGVEEVITAEDIGKFPDKNVADSLARATGVNVVTGSAGAGGFGENERISIRGTDPELNLTLMDGHNMATGDWFVLDQTNGGRSFNYTMLPSEVVGTVEVIKSSSADLPEGGVGGTVDVHVRKPLDLPKNTFALSAQAMYATLADKWSPNVSGMYSWKNDAHTAGFLLGAFYEERNFRRDGEEILGYTNAVNFAGSGKTLAVPSLIGAAYFQQKRVREGGNFVLQFRNDDLEIDFSGLYTRLGADNENHNFMLWGSQLITLNTDRTDADGNPIPALGVHDSGANANSLLTSYTTDGTYVTSASWAAKAGQNAVVQDDIFRQAHSASYDLNLDITYKLNDHVTLKGQAGYTAGEGVTDDSAAWETYWDNVGASYTLGKFTDVSYTGMGSDPTVASYLNNKYSWSWGGTVKSPDREAYAKFDVDYEVGNGFFRDVLFGARYTDHSRTVSDIAYAWAGNGADNGTSNANLGTVFKGGVTPSDYGEGLGDLPTYSYADGNAVYDYLDTHNGGRLFAFYAPSSFGVREKTDAYYLMAKLGGDRWSGNAGVRAVHTKTTSTQYSSSAPTTIDNVFGKFGAVNVQHDYWDYLPSFNLKYNASDDMVLRLGAAKVMTRPAFAQLAGSFTTVFANFTGNAGGNPDLDPYRATQYNAGFEWYYAPQSLFSFTLFHLDIDNFISSHQFTQYAITQQTLQCHQQTPDVCPQEGHDFLMTGPANGGVAKDSGLEVSLQQPFGDTGFGFIANYTYSDGKTDAGAPIDGNSKNTFNLTGYFENEKISTRLAYNFRSKFKSGTDRGTAMWQDDFGTLDGSFSYNVTPHIALTLDAQNLLHEKLYYFVGDPSIPRAYYDNGQSWYAGVRFKY